MSTFAELHATKPVSASPFANGSPFGQAAGAVAAPGADLFGQPDMSTGGGGKFTKVYTLEDQLVLVAPLRIENVMKYDKTGTEEALLARLIVLTGEMAGTDIPEWQVVNTKFVRMGKAALAKGQEFILGRVVMIPTWNLVKDGKFADGDTEGIKKAIAEWAANGARGEKPTSAWTLARYTEEDAAIAKAYLTK